MAKESVAKPMGGTIPPLPNPWVWQTWDDQGRLITLSFTYGVITRLLLAINTHRDSGMAWNRALIGLGPDGSPDTTPWGFDLPEGDANLTNILTDILTGRGLTTIDQILATQVTVTSV